MLEESNTHEWPVVNLADVVPAPWRSVGDPALTVRLLTTYTKACSSCGRRLTPDELIVRPHYFSRICARCRNHLRPVVDEHRRGINLRQFVLRPKTMTRGRVYFYAACFRCPCCDVQFKFVPDYWTHSLGAWRWPAEWPHLVICEACWHFGLECQFVEAQDPAAVLRYVASLRPS